MKSYIKIGTFILFLLLIYTRVVIRYQTPLWADEIEEIRNLTSINHIIFDYLPYIPAGYPGHYLIALPMNMISPGNKFVLGIPGLLSQIFIFLLVPKIISSLKILKPTQVFASAFIARLGLVIDPMLTFQAMEIRPYSLLPILWIGSFFLCLKLLNFKLKKDRLFYSITMALIYAFALLIIFVWHFYGFIMVTTIFFYMLLKLKYLSFKKLIGLPALYLIFFVTIVSLPIWKYFSAGSADYRHPTFELFPNIVQIISSQRGVIKPFSWQNALYLLFMAIVFALLLIALFKIKSKILNSDKKIGSEMITAMLILVIFPILTILILDLLNPYWFLYRQFSWTLIPFYIWIGIFIASKLRLFAKME